MPHALLIGDSIRMRYQPHVRAHLSGQVDVAGPPENCESSRNVRARLSHWLEMYPADLIHLNCGLHDIRVDDPTTGVQVPLEEYAENVGAILRRAQQHAELVVWATSTPINEVLHQQNKLSRRSEADLCAYNRVATEVARSMGVEINDLWQRLTEKGAGSLWNLDGVHFNDEGYSLLGQYVAERIQQCLTGRARRA